MANTSNKLDPEQRATLLTWLAAGHPSPLILRWMRERGWPTVTRQSIHKYARTHAVKLLELRAARYAEALDQGLANRAERVMQLKEHAAALEAIKWVPDERGRLPNEKAWRETLEQIALEVGDRTTRVDVRHSGGVSIYLPERRPTEVVTVETRALPAPANGHTNGHANGHANGRH